MSRERREELLGYPDRWEAKTGHREPMELFEHIQTHRRCCRLACQYLPNSVLMSSPSPARHAGRMRHTMRCWSSPRTVFYPITPETVKLRPPLPTTLSTMSSS